VLLSAPGALSCGGHARRRLGVARDGSFEEVQDARNYLYEVRNPSAPGCCALLV
jgi:hypothetical protein